MTIAVSLARRLAGWRTRRRLKRATAHLDNHMRRDVGLPALPIRPIGLNSPLFPYFER